jgi:hypothetical protein
MIRPVVGDPLKITSIKDTYYRNKNLVNIWPNPATDYFYVNSGDLQLSGLTYISVLDIYGRELIKVPLSERIDISSLQEGMYIIVTRMNGIPVGYNRLIKTR